MAPAEHERMHEEIEVHPRQCPARQTRVMEGGRELIGVESSNHAR